MADQICWPADESRRTCSATQSVRTQSRGTDHINDDVVIDLEVTSNRGDCLGHIGVAREVGVLYGLPTCCPEPSLKCSGQNIGQLTVENQFEGLSTLHCPGHQEYRLVPVRIG